MSGPRGARRGVRRAIAAWGALAAFALPAGGGAAATGMAEPPRLTTQIAPGLPDSLRALGLGGFVVVHLTVDSAGAVTRARVADGGPARHFFGRHAHAFEQAALAAVRRYRFAPDAGRDPAAEWATPVRFDPPADSATTGTLTGTVREGPARRTRGGVGVCAGAARFSTLTDASGAYRIAGLPPGRHEVAFTAQGSLPLRRTVVVRAGRTDTLAVTLAPCPACELARCGAVPGEAPR